MKDFNIEDALDRLQDLGRKTNVLIEGRNKALFISETNITKQYSDMLNPVYNEANQIKKDMAIYYANLEKKSTFNAKTIGNVIAQLMSLCEGEMYESHDSYLVIKDQEKSVYERLVANTPYNVRVIDAVTKGQDTYYSLYEGINRVLVLQKSATELSDTVKFYTYYPDKSYDARMNPTKNVDFGHLKYVEYFVDNVIDYRVKNDIEEISETELYSLMKTFYATNHRAIEQSRKEETAKLLKKQAA